MAELQHVIVGGGVCGAKAAKALRDAGETGPVTLISAEREEPYERPDLSKGFLAGDRSRADLAVHEAGWYAANDVTLRLGAEVASIDPGRRVLALEDGDAVPYDRLLLATGSAPLPLRVPGGDLEGVLRLRTISDSEAIQGAIHAASAAGGPLVVVGGGWIGLEVAAVARQKGLEVTVLETAPHVLNRVLGAKVGDRLAAVHRGHGVDVRTGVKVAALLGDAHVEAVELESGETIDAAAVVTGVGIRPRTALAEAAGLDVEDGVVVDGALRTSDPAIWAAGDVAYAWNEWVGGRLRVEHFANATDQGSFVGRSMALTDREGDRGLDETWSWPPFFWTDQYDVAMEYRGWADPAEARLVLRESGSGDGEQTWFAFWLDDAGRVAAGLHVNGWDDADALKELVRRRATVDPAALADPGTPLVDLPA